MFGDILKGFLQRPVKTERDSAIQFPRNTRYFVIGIQSVLFGEVVTEALGSNSQTKEIEFGRVEPMRKRTHLGGDFLDSPVQLMHIQMRCLFFRGYSGIHTASLHRKQRELLTDIVVKFAGNATALFLLGINKTAAELA